jgi:hypothetical protein
MEGDAELDSLLDGVLLYCTQQLGKSACVSRRFAANAQKR